MIQLLYMRVLYRPTDVFVQVSIRYSASLAVFLLLTSFSEYRGTRILGLFPITGPSHAAVNFALVKELAQRGHQVTVLSPFPQEKPIPNYTDIAVQKMGLEDLLNMSGE
jgi:hypothetical protein